MYNASYQNMLVFFYFVLRFGEALISLTINNNKNVNDLNKRAATVALDAAEKYSQKCHSKTVDVSLRLALKNSNVHSLLCEQYSQS